MAKKLGAGHVNHEPRMHREGVAEHLFSTPVGVRTPSRPWTPDGPSLRALEPSGVYIYMRSHMRLRVCEGTFHGRCQKPIVRSASRRNPSEQKDRRCLPPTRDRGGNRAPGPPADSLTWKWKSRLFGIRTHGLSGHCMSSTSMLCLHGRCRTLVPRWLHNPDRVGGVARLLLPSLHCVARQVFGTTPS